MTRSGFVALAGRPNVGKSTFVNLVVGDKVAIVSDRPQTTRRAIRGVRCRGDLDDCIRCFPATAKWLTEFVDALRDGFSRDEAISEANLVAYGLKE